MITTEDTGVPTRQHFSFGWPMLAAGLLVSSVALAVGYLAGGHARRMAPVPTASVSASNQVEASQTPSTPKPLSNEERLLLLQSAFEKETADPAWAAHAPQLLRQEYAKGPLKSLTLTAECRSTLCKVDYTYTDPVAGLAAVRALAAMHAWEAPQFTHVDTEAQRGTTYIPREGHLLP